MNKITILCLFVMIAVASAHPSESMWKNHPRFRRGADLPDHEREFKDIESEKPPKDDLNTDSSYWYRYRFYMQNRYNFGNQRNFGYYPYSFGYASPLYGNYGYDYPYNYYNF